MSLAVKPPSDYAFPHNQASILYNISNCYLLYLLEVLLQIHLDIIPIK
nr:MAG TPA: hypothetical protein [Caudoviricetes sp.]